MKWAALNFLGLVVTFEVLFWAFGYQPTYQVGYGAFALMGLVIGLTFFWLWWVRATPLALGMSFSWTGASLVMGWWWFYALLERPEVMHQNKVLFIFLALYIAGALQHFTVIQTTMALPRYVRYAAPGMAVLMAIALVFAD